MTSLLVKLSEALEKSAKISPRTAWVLSGAASAGGIGAGVGALSSKKGQKLKGALIGAGVGATAGAGGALYLGKKAPGLIRDYLAKSQRSIKKQFNEKVRNAGSEAAKKRRSDVAARADEVLGKEWGDLARKTSSKGAYKTRGPNRSAGTIPQHNRDDIIRKGEYYPSVSKIIRNIKAPKKLRSFHKDTYSKAWNEDVASDTMRNKISGNFIKKMDNLSATDQNKIYDSFDYIFKGKR